MMPIQLTVLLEVGGTLEEGKRLLSSGTLTEGSARELEGVEEEDSGWEEEDSGSLEETTGVEERGRLEVGRWLAGVRELLGGGV